MRGTNFRVGFGIGGFFLLGGIAMYAAGETWLRSVNDQSGQTFTIIGVIWSGVAILLLVLFVGLALRGRARRVVALTGIDGAAIVEIAETTNTYVNGLPQYRLQVRLERSDGGPTLRCTKRDIVPHTAVGRWGIGTALPVRINRDDPDDFEILWDQLPVPGVAPGGVADELAKLAELSQRGLLSPAEWERAKELYLGKPVDRRAADARTLENLHELFKDGALSESEFNSKKWEILSRP